MRIVQKKPLKSCQQAEKPSLVLYVNGRSSTTSLLADLMGEMFSVESWMYKLQEFFLSKGGLLNATRATLEVFKGALPGYSTEVIARAVYAQLI